MALSEFNVNELSLNPFETLSKEWSLITAGTKEKFNTMTASWGSIGVMWAKNVFVAPIRPSRYTYQFIEKENCFSVCFFGTEYKDQLTFCGNNSGRDIDKVKACGFTPVFFDGVPAFEEASLVLICKKLYRQELNEENFVDAELKANQPSDPMHVVYVSEIVKAYKKD